MRGGPALHVKCAKLHITFQRINANLINFFKGELAVYAWPVSSNDINKIHRGRVKRSMVQNTIIFCVKQVILFNGLTPNLLQKRNVKARLETKFN